MSREHLLWGIHGSYYVPNSKPRFALWLQDEEFIAMLEEADVDTRFQLPVVTALVASLCSLLNKLV